MNLISKNQLWDEFLIKWSVEKVKSMSLEDYTNVGDKNTFTYWLEFGTRDIADIRGSTALKFGIFRRKNTSKKKNINGIIYNQDYAWYSKYGKTKEEAFQTIKANILKVITAIQSQDIDLINEIDISPMVKWKIAFLYQNRNEPIILPIFSLVWLRDIAQDDGINYPTAYRQLIAEKGNQSLLDYAQTLVGAYKSEIANINSNQEMTDDFEQSCSIKPQPLNQILFGSAGTGKTYHTINHALKILDPSLIEDLDSPESTYDRETLTKKFKTYVAKGQVKFVTFHQSFSYEDFVEGIRAESIETELADGTKTKTLEYPVKDGVFLELCKSATTKVEKSAGQHQTDFDGVQHWKMSLGRARYEEDIHQYCIDNHCILLGWGEDLDFSNCHTYQEIEEHMSTHGYADYLKQYPSSASFVHNFKNIMKKGDLIVASDGNHKFRAIGKIVGDYELLKGENDELPNFRQMRKVVWLRQYTPSLANERLLKENKNFSMQTLYKLAHINNRKLSELLAEDSIVDFNEESFVIIIDEINRGNISKIFGELITLIEPNKRKGASEELSITLPYSKQEFSVPNNVYIIGTMNTSDRSLTGIDIALRRRFDFIEMLPTPELLNKIIIESVNVAELLRKMNRRIEVLLDREHCIGHANFMTLKQDSSLHDLAQIFRLKILPLLQEYFFEDWEKINLILNNNGMITKNDFDINTLFPSIRNEDFSYYEDKALWTINQLAFEKIESYLMIIQ